MQYYPNHPIFTALLFGLPKYVAFAQKVHQVHQETQNRHLYTALVKKSIPLVAEQLQLLTMAHKSKRLQQLEKYYNLTAKLEILKLAVENNLFGLIFFIFTPSRSRILP